MTLYFSNSEIRIYRMRRRGSAHRYSVSATFTAYAATIEPIAPERQEFVGGKPGHAFTGFVEVDVEVKEGDEIHVYGEGKVIDKVYSVRGVNIWQGAGMLDHKELILISKDG